MAGYMTKLNGHVYNGEFLSNEPLENGVFAEINAGTVRKIQAAKDTEFRVVEKTTLWGMDAVVLEVISTGKDEVFFVENEWDINDAEVYDTAKYTLPKGKFVKMHRPTVGEQLIMTVTNEVLETLTVGNKAQPDNGGTVKAAV